MSRGKDIRATIETMLEDAAYDWSQDRKNATKRGIFRGLAMALTVMRDPEEWENQAIIKLTEKEFLARVSD